MLLSQLEPRQEDACTISPIKPSPRVKLEARNLSFRYGRAVALKNVCVSLFKQRVTAFMGPSGCGKSTLLRTFNRIHEIYPDQRLTGDILLDNNSILSKEVDVTLLRTRIAMVHQRPAPFPMSIFENVAYGLRLQTRYTPNELSEKVESALREAALWDEVKDQLGESGEALSGGQQQRLCIARTIAPKPEVILMDEPCSALDPASTAKIEELIKTLKSNYTVGIVTHNLEQAARISDYTAFMYLGEVAEFGHTADVFSSPQNLHTRGYLAGHFG